MGAGVQEQRWKARSFVSTKVPPLWNCSHHVGWGGQCQQLVDVGHLFECYHSYHDVHVLCIGNRRVPVSFGKYFDQFTNVAVSVRNFVFVFHFYVQGVCVGVAGIEGVAAVHSSVRGVLDLFVQRDGQKEVQSEENEVERTVNTE